MVCSNLFKRVRALSPAVSSTLKALQAESRGLQDVIITQVDELLPLKNKLDELRKRVKEIKRAMTDVLNNDEDMEMMYLVKQETVVKKERKQNEEEKRTLVESYSSPSSLNAERSMNDDSSSASSSSLRPLDSQEITGRDYQSSEGSSASSGNSNSPISEDVVSIVNTMNLEMMFEVLYILEIYLRSVLIMSIFFYRII